VNRTEKGELVSELETKLKSAKAAFLAKYQGLTVAQTNQFRRELRAVAGECRMTKNTLARRALRQTAYVSAEQWLDGPTALVLGYEDALAVAKIVAKWAEAEAEKFSIKGGIVEGQVIGVQKVVALAKTPSKEVLRAHLLGVLQAPASRLVRLLAEPGAQLARLLGARKEALGPEGDSAEQDPEAK
jgi:large subunit ribosomal protein L10